MWTDHSTTCFKVASISGHIRLQSQLGLEEVSPLHCSADYVQSNSAASNCAMTLLHTQGKLQTNQIRNVSFPFPSPSNMPCHDLGHMLGVLHHLCRFLSKTALIPNGPISLQLTFKCCILIVPYRLHRALQRLDQSRALHSPLHGMPSQSPLWRLAVSHGRQAWSLLILFTTHCAQG